MAESIWADALRRKESALRASDVKFSNDITSKDQFQAALEDVTLKYAESTSSKLIMDKICPRLEHVASFTDAIGSASQAAPYGSAVWGGLLIMIQCTCRFARATDDIIDEIANFQDALPEFEFYIDLYGSDPALQFCLRDIFEDYIDFCICVVKHTKRNPVKHVLWNLVSSSQMKGLNTIKTSMEKHKQKFERKAEAAHRLRTERNYSQTTELAKTTQNEFTLLHSLHSPRTNATRASSHLELFPSTSQSSSGAPSQPPGYPSHLIHTVTLKRNPVFTGRDKELAELNDNLLLTKASKEPKSCAIHGIGGVGKTQLALEYTYRYRPCYDAIFWLRTESNIELIKSFSSIGDRLGIVDDDNEGRRISRILDWLETTDKRWLLVMDNLDDLDTVAAIWPSRAQAGGAVLLTTQKPCDVLRWADHNLALEALDSRSGSQLLLSQIPASTDEQAQSDAAMEISRTVGGLPLWLNALGGFICLSQCTVSECLEIFKSSVNPLDEGSKAGSWSYERSPSAVFDLALSKLSDDAKTLLFLLAFLNPDGVPESVLSIDNPELTLSVLAGSNRSRYFSAIGNLRNSQLVKREGQQSETYLTTHRSVQMAVLRRLNDDLSQRKISFGHACGLLRRVFPRPSPLQQPESDKWPQIQTFLPQLLSLESAFLRASPPIEGSMEVAQLLSDVGLNVWDRGLASDAKSLMLTAEKVLDGMGCDQMAMERSDIHVILGILTDTVGISQREEGLKYRESARSIRKHHFDATENPTREDEIRYFNTITDLACSYQQFNRYDEIEEICRMVLTKYKEWGTEEEYPYEYAKYYHHMAFVFSSQESTRSAVEYAKHATELLELGSFGLLSTLFKFDCATLYFQDGQTDLAIHDHEEVLRRRLLKLGRSNIMTLQSCLALGVIHFAVGHYRDARENLEEVLRQCRNRQLPDELVIRAKFYLALVMQHEGNSEHAQTLKKEAKAGLTSLLHLDRPSFVQNVDEDDHSLYDYLAPWTNRIFIFKGRG